MSGAPIKQQPKKSQSIGASSLRARFPPALYVGLSFFVVYRIDTTGDSKMDDRPLAARGNERLTSWEMHEPPDEIHQI
jgi:hypothetical protein